MKQISVEAMDHLYFFTSQKTVDSFQRACSLSTVFLVVRSKTKRNRGKYEA